MILNMVLERKRLFLYRRDKMEEFEVSGTYIWYYYICKREVWLLAHCMEADQSNDNIRLGNFIHENSYLRQNKEVMIGNNKFDVVSSKKGKIIVGEIKKTSKYLKSAQMQLLFYLKQLKELGIQAEGEILFPEEKKKKQILLGDKEEQELEKIEKEIKEIIQQEKMPNQIKQNFCKNCAYAEFCWS